MRACVALSSAQSEAEGAEVGAAVTSPAVRDKRISCTAILERLPRLSVAISMVACRERFLIRSQ